MLGKVPVRTLERRCCMTIPNINDLASFVLVASPKNEVCYNATMFNKSSIRDWLIVFLPKHYIDTAVEYVSEVGSGVSEANIAEDCVCVKGRHWVDIPTEKLNLVAGYHLYRIQFVDSLLGVENTLYFAYNIQDDNPATPYIYMNRNKETSDDET